MENHPAAKVFVNQKGRDFLPLFEAGSGLEFHAAMHNIAV
jgi:hypothetical protein